MEKNDVILSICIPTRNRGKKLFTTIKKILKYKFNDIELIVVDNNSTDDTIELLKTIKDERFKLFENSKNIGAYPNFFKALSLGKGKYLQALHDRDMIDESKLGSFIDFIKDKEYAVICNRFIGNVYPLECNLSEAAYFLNGNSHISYFVFNRRIFHKIKNKERYLNIKYTGCYPLVAISLEMCCYGNYFWNKKIHLVKIASNRTLGRYESKSNEGSNTEKTTLFSGYEPKGRLFNYLHLVKYVFSDNLLKENANEMIYLLFESELKWATWNYIEFMGNGIQVKRHNYQGSRKYNIIRANFGFYYSALRGHQLIGVDKILDKKLLWKITYKNAMKLIKSKMGFNVDYKNYLLNKKEYK